MAGHCVGGLGSSKQTCWIAGLKKICAVQILMGLAGRLYKSHQLPFPPTIQLLIFKRQGGFFFFKHKSLEQVPSLLLSSFDYVMTRLRKCCDSKCDV